MDTLSAELSHQYRKRAYAAEQKARSTEDLDVRSEWALMAVEWHLLANAAAPRELQFDYELED